MNDIEVGTWLYFHPNGVLKRSDKFDFKNEDVFLSFTFDTFTVKDPTMNGWPNFDTIISNTGYKKPLETIEYFPNGKIMFEKYYNNRKRTGVWKFYNENGILLKEETYREDILVSKKVY